MESEPLLAARRSRWPEVVSALVACLAPLSGGMAHGFSSPAIPELERAPAEGGLGLSGEQLSRFAAALTLGAVLGGPLAALLLDRCGRKLTLMLSALPLNVGWLLLVSATSSTVWLLHVSRVVIGLGVGMGSAVAPVYISEIASAELRGRLGACFQACIMLGLLLAYLLGVALRYAWLAVLSSLVAALLPLLVVALRVAETPRWLVSRQQHDRATAAIQRLRNYRQPHQAEQDCAVLRANMSEQRARAAWSDLLHDAGVRKAVTLSLLCMLGQQLSGMNALAFYAQPVLLEAGFGALAGLMSVLLAAVVTLATIASSFVLDRLGRRRMLVISGLVMCVSCAAFGAYSLAAANHAAAAQQWWMKAAAFVSLACYVSGFALGWGPAPWVIMSEILPNQWRGRGSSLATSVNWLCAFLVVRGFHLLQTSISTGGAFLLFSGLNLAAAVFALACVPETKGKSLEEIQRFLYGTTAAAAAAL